MLLEVGDLRRATGNEKKFTGRDTRLEVEMRGGTLVYQDIQISGTARNIGGYRIYVKGTITARADLTCSLCLNPFSIDIDTPFAETYYEAGTAGASDGDSGRLYQGDQIDLSDLIIEGLILAVPMKPVCRTDCKGLCPSCGRNLNTGECGCDRLAPDPRLAVLGEYLKNE